MPVNKSELRRSLLEQRQSLSEMEWRQKSDRICTHLRGCSKFADAKTVLAYFSFRREPDLSSLWVHHHQKFWGFPRCVAREMIWHRWRPGDPQQKGAFGLIEPEATLPTLEPSEVDLILVPALACDAAGYRLGYGGGFYDRMLSRPGWREVQTIGIIFESAYFPKLPVEDWDRPLGGICTETGWIELTE